MGGGRGPSLPGALPEEKGEMFILINFSSFSYWYYLLFSFLLKLIFVFYHCCVKNTDSWSKHIMKRKVSAVDNRCNQCGKQYKEESGLWRHIRSLHKGIRYDCNQCDKQFTEQNNLTRHIQSIHEGGKYSCYQCTYQAKRKC